MKASQVRRVLNVTQQTLRNYIKQGKLHPIRLSQTKCEYDDDEVYGLIGKKQAKERIGVTYGRVSTSKQRGDLERQNERLMEFAAANGIAVDLNPTNIGYAVLERTGEGECRAVECGMFDLSRLCVKTGLSSSDPRQKYLNNKRKYEISIIVKSLFRIASHYKCSEFVMEDLDGVSEASSGTETNRKVRNVWNRLFIEGLILRRCNETGIILTKVNPAYSSFIGNIKHGYADSTNAAVEIGRRGLWKYNKGTFYPNVTLEDIRTVEARFGKDAGYDTPCDWVAMYKALRNAFPDGKEFSHRLRPALGDLPTGRYRTFSMNSYKSEINHTIFNINFNKIY